jgi:hypothetical protein
MQVSLLLKNIPFEVERTACSRMNALLGRRPSSAPFLSGDTFRAMADHVFDETGSLDCSRVEEGSVVFVGTRRLGEFEELALPRIDAPFVLVTHQGDLNIDERYGRIADNPGVLHWFAQNCLLRHPKASPLPIGLEDRWRHNNGEYSDFRRLSRKASPTIPRIAFGFTLGTNVERRTECYKAMAGCPAARELHQPMNASLYRNSVRDYMLVASPPGNGLDCHRTWEAMYLGCVPIVEDNLMNRSFRDAGAPMILVNSWGEVSGWTEDQVERRYADCIAERDDRVLFADYWRAAFREKARA